MSVANWWLFSLVVRWFCNGLFRFCLSILLAFYSHFLPMVGPLSSWWVLPLMNKPPYINRIEDTVYSEPLVLHPLTEPIHSLR